MLIKVLVIALLIAILASLGSGLLSLARGQADSGRTVRALTVRITLSVLLFLLLLVAWFAGLIEPHGLVPGR